jgi:hypothetical protein
VRHTLIVVRAAQTPTCSARLLAGRSAGPGRWPA